MVYAASLPMPVAKAEVEDLEQIRDELGRRGRPTRLICCGVMGEMDVRLKVGAVGALMVELLGPFGDHPRYGRWHAVRLTPGCREVWCGPTHSAALSETIAFVEHLLSDDIQHAAGRYDRLG